MRLSRDKTKEYNRKWELEKKEERANYKKEWYQKNKEKLKEYAKERRNKNPRRYKEWRENNPEKVKEGNRRYYQKHKERLNNQSKMWRERNSEYIKKWKKENHERMKELAKKWPSKKREHRNRHQRNYLKKNPDIRISQSVSAAISCSLRGEKQGRHWETLVGYTIKDLMEHLEGQFEPWMTWDNRGRYSKKEKTWQIDHIIPRSHFKYKTAEDPEFKKCWALENLQPLEAMANIKKGNSYRGEALCRVL